MSRLRPVVVGGRAYVAAGDAGLIILDVSDPAHPAPISTLDGSFANSVDVVGERAYVSVTHVSQMLPNSSELLSVDISNPANPQVLGRYALKDGIGIDDIQVVGALAYILTASENGLLILNIEDPAHPALVGRFDTEAGPKSLQVIGTRAYILTYFEGILVIDVHDPTAPTQLAAYAPRGEAHGLTIVGERAFINDNYGLLALDIRRPAHPQVIGQYDTAPSGFIANVAVVDNLAYVAAYMQGMRIFDIRDSSRPRLIGDFQVKDLVPRALQVVGSLAFLADLYGKLRILDVHDPAAPRLLSTFISSYAISDVKVVGTRVYVADQTPEKDQKPTLAILDVSDPSVPKLIGQYYSPYWIQKVTLVGTKAYII